MKHFRNTFWLLFLLLSALTLKAQNTVSPYSIFGPGEVQPKGFGKNIGMGRAGIALPSDLQLNNLNPASYTGIDSLHFIFELGLDGKFSRFDAKGSSSRKLNGNMTYLAMGFPITRWWANSFGISPYSSIGYMITADHYVEGTGSKYYTQYSGSGGITMAYWANAFRLTKHLSLGVNSAFVFGPLTQEEYIYQPDLKANYTITQNHYLHSFYFDYGLQYTIRMNKMVFGTGITYANRQSLVSGYNMTVQDANLGTVDSKEGKKGKRDLPETAGVGLMMSNPEIYTLAVDYQFQRWSAVKYPVMPGTFSDAHSFSAGIEFKPWKMSVSNRFYQNWTYRAGANYSSSYLRFGSKVIDKTSISLGIGVPLPGRISVMNLAFEAGQQGTAASGLVRERYILAHINFSLNEFWFLKNKYY